MLTASDEVLREILALEQARNVLEIRERAQDDFMVFVKHVYDGFIEGSHHKQVAKQFEKLSVNRGSRIIVHMPPRHTKSEFASYLLPAWFLGQYPEMKIIQTPHTAELAVGFGRKVRTSVGSKDLKDIFRDVSLQSASKAAGRWNTTKGGEYFAIGVGGA